MRKYLIMLTLLCCLNVGATAISSPASVPARELQLSKPVDPLAHFASLSMKDLQQLAGRKFSLKEKIAIKIFQWKMMKQARHPQEDVKDLGKTAMIFGILGIGLLFIPVIGGVTALIAAILALVVGYKARRKNPADKKARTGILLGWITIGLFVVLLALVIAILSTWSM